MAEKKDRNVWFVEAKHPAMSRYGQVDAFSGFYEAIDCAVEFSKKNIHIKIRVVDGVTNKVVMIIDK